MRKVIHTLRMLSLDVVLGALASGSMAAAILGQPMPWTWWLALPLGVWVCYTADHLFDAYRLQSHAHTDRHLFHYRYFRSILVIWLTLIVAGAIIFISMMPRPLLLLGMILGMISGLHLLLAYLLSDHVSIWLQKELGVAGIYTLGIWGGPAVLYADLLSPMYYWITGQFFMVALINLLLFSAIELYIDEIDGHTSWVRALGYSDTIKLSALLCVGVLISPLGMYLFDMELSWVMMLSETIICIMTLILCIILLFPTYYKQKDRYRIWGDGIFLLPSLSGLWVYWP